MSVSSEPQRAAPPDHLRPLSSPIPPYATVCSAVMGCPSPGVRSIEAFGETDQDPANYPGRGRSRQ